MATITIRHLPDDLVSRIKAAAARNKRSMEQEIRELLHERYLQRQEILERIRERWGKYPAPSAKQVNQWIQEGRQNNPHGL